MNTAPSSELDLGAWPKRRIRLVRQAETTECGLASLAMVLRFWGSDLDLPALRRQFGVSSRGMSLGDMILVVDQLGFAARPVRVELEALGSLDLPAVLHWDMNHFVVLERVRGDRAWIADPAIGTRCYDKASLSRHFTGIALELQPTADFIPQQDTRRLGFRQLWGSIRGLKRALAQVALLSVVLQAHVLASPYLLQVAVDQALPALDLDLLTVLGVGFMLFACVYAAAYVLRAMVLLAAGTALSFGIASNLGRRLFRLPVDWFQKRSVGDILSRFQSVQPIEKLLTESAPAALIDGMLALLTLAMMTVYSRVLVIVPLVSLALYAGFRLLTLPAERNSEGERIMAQGREQTTMIESLQGIVTLRLAGHETLRHAAWKIRLSDSLNARFAHDRVRAYQQAFGALLTALEQVLVTWLAVSFAMRGGFSIGMIFAFLGYQLNFSASMRRLVDETIAARMLGLHLDRLSDIALEPEDAGFHETARQVAATPPAVLELRNVTYTYSPLEEPVINGLDLRITAGEHVAITGPSGGGKSTLVKLLLGLIEPSGGEVAIDGVALARYGRRNLRRHVGAVLQDDVLFDGDIAQNVAAFDVVDEERLGAALRSADIAADIEQMPMRHYTLVGHMGSNLSGGQRQRILLARALYRNPAILVMDEGTAHLDPEAESRVNTAIAAMGITRIMVAHRQETIAAAQRVIRVVDGRIVSDTCQARMLAPAAPA